MTEPELNIGGRKLSSDTKSLIIAEIGTAHGGDLNKAFELIDAAAESGACCAKFQIVFADEIVHPLCGNIKLPSGSIPIYETFKSLEKDYDFFAALKEYTENKNLIFLCSSFGIKSTEILTRLNVAAYKVASPELNHYPLLRKIKQTNKPVILSTGVSTMEDISLAVQVAGDQTAILHCITSYPAPEEEYNLKVIKTLRNKFNLICGISDHSKDPILVPVLSTAFGAKIIEKHFTLDKKSNGLDDNFALTPDEFFKMTQLVREAEKMRPKDVYALLCYDYGEEHVKKLMGNGEKDLAFSEIENYYTTNRSALALRDIQPGEILNEENSALLRSEKNLKPGIRPELWEQLLGVKVQRFIPSGHGISKDEFNLDHSL